MVERVDRNALASGSNWMNALLNWFPQVGAILRFGLMSIPQRRGAVASTVIGIAGVVAVLVGVLSIAAGFRHAMARSGRPDGVLVLRSGADTEMVSGLGRESTRLIADAPGVGRGRQGPQTSAELFVILNLPKQSTGTDANVALRGVEPAAFDVRDHVRIVAGRPFAWGRNQVIAGVGAAREFAGLRPGAMLKVGRQEWEVTGTFSTDGDVAESEIWTDARVLQDAYQRGDTFQSVRVRLHSPASYQQFKDAVTSNPQLTVRVQRESDYYAEQSETVTRLITTLGVLIAGLMAMGALFGALNTMYSAVAARTREIGTLRALGFGAGAVVAGLLIESLVLAVIGGAAGGGLAYQAFNGFQTATMNWQTFSQVTFAFAVTPRLLVEGMAWAVAIGLVGGLLPAIRAARLPVAVALRET